MYFVFGGETSTSSWGEPNYTSSRGLFADLDQREPVYPSYFDIGSRLSYWFYAPFLDHHLFFTHLSITFVFFAVSGSSYSSWGAPNTDGCCGLFCAMDQQSQTWPAYVDTCSRLSTLVRCTEIRLSSVVSTRTRLLHRRIIFYHDHELLWHFYNPRRCLFFKHGGRFSSPPTILIPDCTIPDVFIGIASATNWFSSIWP